MNYYEVRYFQPAENKFDRLPTLDGAFSHPDRWVHVICWEDSQTEDPAIKRLRMVDGEGRYEFANGRCPIFLGEYAAEIVGEVSEDQHMRRDRDESA